MKKITTLFLLIFAGLFGTVSAAYLKNSPVTVLQPDGTELHCFVTGDEFYNWMHDANGFTIMQHPQTGYYVYAQKQGDSLIVTNFIAGNVNPANTGLKPYLNISAEKMEAKRNYALSLIPLDSKKEVYAKSLNLKTQNTLNNIVIYIRFSDQVEYTKDTTYYWSMFNNLSPEVSSMLRFFQATSYNKLNVISHFYPKPSSQTVVSYQDTYPRSYYLPYNANSNPNGYAGYESTSRKEAMLKRAIQYVTSQIPANLNLDYNGDGNVDNICFIVRGATGVWSDLLWPHRSSLYYESVSINGSRVKDYNFQLEEHLNENQSSVLCHEMFHTFGAPDLYKYSDSPGVPVGTWDLMATNTRIPQSMCAYLKYKCVRWIDQIPEITKNGVYTLKTVWNEDKCIYKIKSPNSSTEYFTIEYRNKESHFFDQGISGSGLLIYRINSSVDGNLRNSTNEIYVFRPNATNDDTEGSINDAVFSADKGRTEFNNNTNPTCFLSNGQAGGIHIRNISEIGDSMTFEVVFPTVASPDFTASNTVITPGCSIDFSNLTSGYADSYLWTFEGATVPTSTDKNPAGIVYNTPGSYKVKLLVRNEYGENTMEKNSYIVVTSQAPNITMSVSDSIGCSLDTIQFFGNADGCPQSWSWSFSPNTYTFVGGTSASSQNPKVFFNNNTTYSVSLTVANANGSNAATKSNIVSIGGRALSGNSTVESFDDSYSISDIENKGWSFFAERNAQPWELFEINTGQKIERFIGVKLIKSGSDTKKKSWIISPSYKLDNDYVLSFHHSYCYRTIYSETDSLNIYITTDCGENWTLLNAYGDNKDRSFVTHSDSYSSFIPTTDADWCKDNCIQIDLSGYKGSESVKFKFEVVRYSGNNLFLDDITIKKKSGIPNAPKEDPYIVLYPNPNKGIFTILSRDKKIQNAELTIYNIEGGVTYKSILKGEKNEFNLSYLPSGIYFLKIKGKDVSQQLKLVKQ